MPDDVQESKIVEKWAKADLGDRVHIDNLLAWVPMAYFNQLEPGGPSFCEMPTMTFRCAPDELPYYTRIE